MSSVANSTNEVALLGLLLLLLLLIYLLRLQRDFCYWVGWWPLFRQAVLSLFGYVCRATTNQVPGKLGQKIPLVRFAKGLFRHCVFKHLGRWS